MSKNIVICIARQFGSGGRQVGQALAQALGISFYDKELLRAAAQKSGILQELFEKHDEKPVSSLGMAPLPGDPMITLASYDDYLAYMPNEQYQNIIADVIREVASVSSCVIIGRCADYILRGSKSTLSVFVHAPLEVRVQRIQRLHNLDEDAARSLVRKTDHSRASYYSYFTDRDWGQADNYHLALDAGYLGVERSVALLKAAAEIYSG